MSLCEVCDRDVFMVYREARSRTAWPRGDGRGWMVLHIPNRVRSMSLADALAGLQPTVAYKVFTCGTDVCVHRARHNGVPGQKHEAA